MDFRRWRLRPMRGTALTALAVAAGATLAVLQRCWASAVGFVEAPRWLEQGRPAQATMGLVARQAARVITEDEVLRVPPMKKKRRGRVYLRKDGEWQLVVKDQPLPTPSEDPSKLSLQIGESGKALRLLEFLEQAVHSPAFELKHAVKALDTLMAQRPSLSEEALEGLNDQPGLAALVGSTEIILQELGKDEDAAGLGARWSTLMLHALAVYQEIPLLNRLVVPVAEEAAQAVAEMNNKQVARCVWAIAELKHVSRLLQDNLLPLLVQNSRLLGVRSYLKAKAPFEYSLLRQGLYKLRRDVPYLREFLPGPE